MDEWFLILLVCATGGYCIFLLVRVRHSQDEIKSLLEKSETLQQKLRISSEEIQRAEQKVQALTETVQTSTQILLDPTRFFLEYLDSIQRSGDERSREVADAVSRANAKIEYLTDVEARHLLQERRKLNKAAPMGVGDFVQLLRQEVRSMEIYAEQIFETTSCARATAEGVEKLTLCKIQPLPYYTGKLNNIISIIDLYCAPITDEERLILNAMKPDLIRDSKLENEKSRRAWRSASNRPFESLTPDEKFKVVNKSFGQSDGFS